MCLTMYLKHILNNMFKLYVVLIGNNTSSLTSFLLFLFPLSQLFVAVCLTFKRPWTCPRNTRLAWRHLGFVFLLSAQDLGPPGPVD